MSAAIKEITSKKTEFIQMFHDGWNDGVEGLRFATREEAVNKMDKFHAILCERAEDPEEIPSYEDSEFFSVEEVDRYGDDYHLPH